MHTIIIMTAALSEKTTLNTASITMITIAIILIPITIIVIVGLLILFRRREHNYDVNHQEVSEEMLQEMSDIASSTS